MRDTAPPLRPAGQESTATTPTVAAAVLLGQPRDQAGDVQEAGRCGDVLGRDRASRASSAASNSS
uniref:Uncharacterized protein n=1 Tax=Streptomyces sp. NBC_00008 TaxID=2903610 RepID=A0AAU2VIE4_9ACTN